MAGEYKIAAEMLQHALQTASDDANMSSDTMVRALLHELLTHLAAGHSRKQLDDMISYQLDNMDEDEFVVTRGC